MRLIPGRGRSLLRFVAGSGGRLLMAFAGAFFAAALTAFFAAMWISGWVASA
jgi:hypothetical protein